MEMDNMHACVGGMDDLRDNAFDPGLKPNAEQGEPGDEQLKQIYAKAAQLCSQRYLNK